MPSPNIQLSRKDLENAERIEKDLRRRLAMASKRVAKLFKDTAREEKFEKLGLLKGEIKEDVLMDKDIEQLLMTMIRAFKDIVLLLKYIAIAEEDQGKDGIKIHKRDMGAIEWELRTLAREIFAATRGEKA